VGKGFSHVFEKLAQANVAFVGVGRAPIEKAFELCRHLDAFFDLGVAKIGVEGITRGQETDQDQHDQPDPFLTVVRAMGHADRRARAHQNRADPRRGRLIAGGGLFEAGIIRQTFDDQIQSASQQKAHDR
jgi:hypothetical protein